MEVDLLNSSFQRIHVLDTFSSLIWTDRYWLCGDFELKTPPTETVLTKLASTKYLKIKESEHHMVFEDSNLTFDIDEGPSLLLTGRSLESILDRRITWAHTILFNGFQTKILALLDTNIISPSDTTRKIDNFEYVASTDPAITGLSIGTQSFGDTLYKLISDLCREKNVGFKITYTTANKFRFELYAGKNRSYNQSVNPFVVFSPDFDNLINSNYLESSRLLKTIVLVEGEKVGTTRTTQSAEAPGGALSGLNRREMFYKSDLTRESQEEQDYLDQLKGKGKEELSKNVFIQAFDGEADTTLYKFGDDFFMGDILQIEDSYGHNSQLRVTEMIYSQNKEGIKIYPTFTTLE